MTQTTDTAVYSPDDVVITRELAARPNRAPDHEGENRALRALAEAMSTAPDTVLQRLVEMAMALTRSDSAGISLLEPGGANGNFRWVATTGAWSPYCNGTMPREASPCGEVIAQRSILLMKDPARAFPALLQAAPGVGEVLLAPFAVGGVPTGTIWVIKHGPDERFEAEDTRLLESLAGFASAAHQTVQALRMAESAGQHAEARLEHLITLVEVSSEFIGTCGMDFIPTYANAAAMRMVGLSDLEQVKQTPLSAFFFPEDLPFITDEFFPRVLREGEAKVEVRFRHFLTGEPVWVDYSLVVLNDAMGRPTGLGTVTHDLTERKRTEAALLASEARQAFLLKLSDALRPMSDPGDIMAAASEALGRHLGVGRAGYGKVDADNEWFIVERDWTDGAMPSLVGRQRVADFGPESVAAHQSDRAVVVDDGLTDARFAGFEAAFDAIQTRASIVVPLIKDGRWIAGFYAQQSTPRHWTQDDERLVRDVVERTWAAVERAHAEVALRESRERYLALFNAIDQGFCTIEMAFDENRNPVDYRFLEVSPTFERQTGIADGAGRWMREIAPDHDQHWFDIYGRVALTGEPVRFTNFSTPLGRWWEVYAFRVTGLHRVAILFRDITDHKRAEETLRDSEWRLRALATVGSSSVYRMSPDWREMRQLDGAAFLADTDKATADWVDTYIPPDERPRVREAISRAIADKGIFELEHRVLRADNTVGWTFSRAIPLLDDAGGISEWFGAATDVTARVKADQSFMRLFQASPAPFLVLKPNSPHFTILEVNDAYLSATMRTRDQVVGRGIFEAYPDNPFDETVGGESILRASLERVLASRQPDVLPGLKYDIARPDGAFEERWWSPVNSAVLDDDGEVEALIHNAHDVTEERRSEAALRESEERFRSVTEAIDDVFYMTDLNQGALLYLSPSFERVWGTPPTEMMRDLSNFVNSIHPEDRLAAGAAMAAQQRGEPAEAEYRILRPDGEIRWIHDRCFPVSGNGRRRSAGVASDVTARKAAEAALRDSEALFRQFNEFSSDVIWIRDAETMQFEYVSPAIEAVYGVAPEEFAARHNDLKAWAEILHPDDRAHALDGFRRVRAGERVTHEFRIQRPDGEIRWIRDTDFPLIDDQGRVQRVAGIGQDITDLKRGDERQKTLLAELQHRVRNILAMIRSVTVRSAETAESVEDYCQHLEGRIGTMARTQNLLTRHIGSGVDLQNMILDELSAQAAQHTQFFVTGPDVALPAKAAEVLALAVHELATNAVKYGALDTKGGRVDVRWAVLAGDPVPKLSFIWSEFGVRIDTPPTHRGFGTELITERVPYELRGMGNMEFRNGGLVATIEFPLIKSTSILQTDPGQFNGTS